LSASHSAVRSMLGGFGGGGDIVVLIRWCWL